MEFWGLSFAIFWNGFFGGFATVSWTLPFSRAIIGVASCWCVQCKSKETCRSLFLGTRRISLTWCLRIRLRGYVTNVPSSWEPEPGTTLDYTSMRGKESSLIPRFWDVVCSGPGALPRLCVCLFSERACVGCSGDWKSFLLGLWHCAIASRNLSLTCGNCVFLCGYSFHSCHFFLLRDSFSLAERGCLIVCFLPLPLLRVCFRNLLVLKIPFFLASFFWVISVLVYSICSSGVLFLCFLPFCLV